MKKKYYNQLTTEEFIAKAILVHGNKYNYSKVLYVNRTTKVCIICPIHGEFMQAPFAHINGQGCPACGRIKQAKNHRQVRNLLRPDLYSIEVPAGSRAVPVGTKGDYALVDEEDYERVSEHNWYFIRRYAYSKNTGLMHRFIMDTPEGMDTDHINQDTLDNRKINLRICTHQENMYNRLSAEGATSKYKGVHWHKASNRWVAAIKIDGKTTHLGIFHKEIDAARAYDTAAKGLSDLIIPLNIQSE